MRFRIKSLQRVEGIIAALVPEGYQVTAKPKYDDFWKDRIDCYVVEVTRVDSKDGEHIG